MDKVKQLKELEARGEPIANLDPREKTTNIYFDTEMSEIAENKQEEDDLSEFKSTDIPRLGWASSVPKFAGVKFTKILPPN